MRESARDGRATRAALASVRSELLSEQVEQQKVILMGARGDGWSDLEALTRSVETSRESLIRR
jgi:hypothetical protein